MTIETWKAEFYPVRAIDCDPKDALDHSILKWSGLTHESMAKHELNAQKHFSDMFRLGKVAVDASTCALCVSHRRCNGCPLYLSRDHIPCDEVPLSGLRSGEVSPYDAFRFNRDAQPMITALAAAKVWVLAREAEIQSDITEPKETHEYAQPFGFREF